MHIPAARRTPLLAALLAAQAAHQAALDALFAHGSNAERGWAEEVAYQDKLEDLPAIPDADEIADREDEHRRSVADRCHRWARGADDLLRVGG